MPASIIERDIITEVIEECIGKLKRWQLRTFLLLAVVYIPVAMQELSIVFIAPKEQQFWCEDKEIDKCSPDCPARIFDKNVFDVTITSQWDMVCERAWLRDVSQSLLMSGVFAGHIVFGALADKYGRRKPMIGAVIMEFIVGVGVAFVPYLWMFNLLRFLMAAAAGGTSVMGMTMTIEIIGKKKRPYFGIMFQMSYYVGHALLGVVAYFLTDWRALQLSIAVPTVILISYYWLLPESPRWLLATNRRAEAVEILRKAQIYNRMPETNIEALVENLEIKPRGKENFLDLFKTPNVRIKTFLIYLNLTILGLTYFGVAQYMGEVGGNKYVNVIVSGLIQIPGSIGVIFIIGRKGRKFSGMGAYLMCGIACLCITFSPEEPTWIIATLGCISMMFISLGFATIWFWCGELFPTVVRNVGLGSSAVFSKVGSMTAPLVAGLRGVPRWVIPLIFGVSPLIGFVSCFRLPETLNRILPDTLEEAEEFDNKR